MMKYSLLSAFIIMLGLAACQSSGDGAGKANVEVVEKYVQAVIDKDSDAMAALLADNYEGYGPSLGDTISRAEAMQNWELNTSELYESINYDRIRLLPVTVSDGPNPGDYVSMYSIVSINFQGELGSVKTWANTVYKIENGKIATTYTFYNEMDVLEQLGYGF